MMKKIEKECAVCGLKDQYCAMCSLAVKSIPLTEVLKKYSFQPKLRRAFLSSNYAKETTLSGILKRPKATWSQLNLIPGTGKKTIEDICAAVHVELSLVHPWEYSVAGNDLPVGIFSPADFENLDHNTLAQLQEFFKVWGPLGSEKQLSMTFHLRSNEDRLESGGIKAYEKWSRIYIPQFTYCEVGSSGLRKARSPLSVITSSPFLGFDVLNDKYRLNSVDILIILDRHMMSDFRHARGAYQGLDEAERLQQLALLEKYFSYNESVLVVISDLLAGSVAPGFAVDKNRFFHKFCGGLMEISSPEIVARFFHGAYRAAASGVPLKDWLSEN